MHQSTRIVPWVGGGNEPSASPRAAGRGGFRRTAGFDRFRDAGAERGRWSAKGARLVAPAAIAALGAGRVVVETRQSAASRSARRVCEAGRREGGSVHWREASGAGRRRNSDDLCWFLDRSVASGIARRRRRLLERPQNEQISAGRLDPERGSLVLGGAAERPRSGRRPGPPTKARRDRVLSGRVHLAGRSPAATTPLPSVEGRCRVGRCHEGDLGAVPGFQPIQECMPA